MTEPIEPMVPTPRGGWPKALIRLELMPPLSLDDACRECAVMSRNQRRGVIANYSGSMLMAFPHQSVDEIARTWKRMFEMAGGARMASDRWTFARKAWVCLGVDTGMLTESQACVTFDLSVEELTSWLVAYRANGPEGLKIKHLPDRFRT